jgi:hypothetical protein
MKPSTVRRELEMNADGAVTVTLMRHLTVRPPRPTD